MLPCYQGGPSASGLGIVVARVLTYERAGGDKRAAVEAALARNEGLNKIVKLTGAGKSTVRRIKRELEAVAS